MQSAKPRCNVQILNWRTRLDTIDRGRPQMMWKDNIKRDAGLAWNRQAQNRLK